ncbi:PREDICTED: uncharacterized protein LOC105143694 [Acromyrmex echinatior]|uniref:uncharacterized protein LOC105143694 n=1 Tax=Acromyrmex echinatior TaxID=103372 RepID=UPI0005810505|nr:PREDICTED: uncharacterized protein LOC105143694 [Acromyrmex echinatior]
MKSNTAEELSRIYNAAISAVNSQESIGRPINSHDFFNHFIIELFDSKIRLEWESHMNDSTDLPDHDILMDFITKRILTLKAAKLKVTKVFGDPKSRIAKSHVAKRTTDAPGCARVGTM